MEATKLKDVVTTIERTPTWGDILTSIKRGEKIVINSSDANYVRSAISASVKINNPKMFFFTKKVVEDGKEYLIITRER